METIPELNLALIVGAPILASPFMGHFGNGGARTVDDHSCLKSWRVNSSKILRGLMEVKGICKKCGAEVTNEYAEAEESGEIVVVDKQTQETLVLNKGDKLCKTCSQLVDYYRRIGDC